MRQSRRILAGRRTLHVKSQQRMETELRCIRGIPLTRIHRTRCDGVDADASTGELLRRASSEVFDGGFGAGVGCVQAGESGQQRGHDCDDFASVMHVLCGLLQDQECCFGVDTENIVSFDPGRCRARRSSDGLTQTWCRTRLPKRRSWASSVPFRLCLRRCSTFRVRQWHP